MHYHQLEALYTETVVCKKQFTHALRFRTNVSDPLFTKLSRSTGPDMMMKPELRTISWLTSKNTYYAEQERKPESVHMCARSTLVELQIIDKNIRASWTQLLLLRNYKHAYRLIILQRSNLILGQCSPRGASCSALPWYRLLARFCSL